MKTKKRKNRFPILSSERGAILPMVLMAGVLMAGVSYYVISLDEEGEKDNLRLKFKTEVNQIVNHINFLLANPKYCMLTITDPALDLGVTNRLTNPTQIITKIDESVTPPVPLTVDSRGNAVDPWTYRIETNGDGSKGYYESRVKIKSFTLDSDPLENDPEKYKSEFLLVEIVNKKLLTAKGGPETYLKKIPLYVEWAPPRDMTAAPDPVNFPKSEGNLPPKSSPAPEEYRITNCRAVSNTDDQLWSLGDSASAYYGKTITDPTTEVPVRVGINIVPPEDNADTRFDSELIIGDPAAAGSGNAIASDDTISTNFTYHSDSKLKKNVKNISNAMDVVQSLRGVGFNWTEDNRKDFGFIAQEVEDELPEIVRTNPITGLKKLDYAKMIPFLVDVFQQQQRKIKLLKKRVQEIQK